MTMKRTPSTYSFSRELGQGSYSTVLLARDKQYQPSTSTTNNNNNNINNNNNNNKDTTQKGTEEYYAAKILNKKHILKNNKVKYVNIEKEVLNRTEHAFIVRLWATFQDQESLCKNHLQGVSETEGERYRRDEKDVE